MRNATIKLKWAFHNIVGHPISGFLDLVGLEKASEFVHNATLPMITFDNLIEANPKSKNYGKKVRVALPGDRHAH